MYLFFIFSFVIFIIKIGDCYDDRIVGGSPIDISDAPYQVSLLYYGQHICGGSIIGSQLILSAAHCVAGHNKLAYEVRVGSSYHYKNGQIVKVKNISQHQHYNKDTTNFDACLLFLEVPVQLSDTVKIVPMIKAGANVVDNTMCQASGWGAMTEKGISPVQLHQVDVPIMNHKVCKNLYSPRFISRRMICAGYTSGEKDSCQGDSGGPLVCNGILTGIVSWGIGCARPNQPGVYTKISTLHPWIKRQTKRFLCH